MGCSPPGSSVHAFSRPEYWSRLPCCPPGELPDSGSKPMSLVPPALAGGFFTTSATWEAPHKRYSFSKKWDSTSTPLSQMRKWRLDSSSKVTQPRISRPSFTFHLNWISRFKSWNWTMQVWVGLARRSCPEREQLWLEGSAAVSCWGCCEAQGCVGISAVTHPEAQ